MPDTSQQSTDAAADPPAIALVRELARLRVLRRGVRRVVLRSRVRVEEETLAAELEDVRVEVERVAVGRPVTEAPAVRVEGDVTIFPILEERMVVTRQLVLTEEIHVRRVAEVRRAEVPVTLRREIALLERIDAQTGQILSQDELSTEGNEP